MRLSVYRTLQALILAGLGFGLLVKIMDGRVLLYIHQRFVVLVLLAALAMIALAQIILRERTQTAEDGDTHTPHAASRSAAWGLWLTALPLLVGLLVPERPLGAGALETRGIFTTTGTRAFGGAAASAALPSTQRTILDWVRVYGEAQDEAAAAAYTGQEADVSGFITHDARLASEQFLVGRFAISCCVADASALGMVVAWPDAARMTDNRWVRVRGPVRPLSLDGRIVPAIDARDVELIPEPALPYLFP